MRFVTRIGAAIRLGLLLRRGLGDRQQGANALDVVGAHRAGEQAVMADTVETARQHVHEEPADELGGFERHGLEAVAFLDPDNLSI